MSNLRIGQTPRHAWSTSGGNDMLDSQIVTENTNSCHGFKSLTVSIDQAK